MTRNIKELFARDVELRPQCGKIFINQPQRKFIVACRHGRMCCKNILSACFFESLLKGAARSHQFARPFNGQESRVAFVHVPDRGIVSERTQHADAAHTQNNFLHHAQVKVGPIEARG